jgi:hypothetical protein
MGSAGTIALPIHRDEEPVEHLYACCDIMVYRGEMGWAVNAICQVAFVFRQLLCSQIKLAKEIICSIYIRENSPLLIRLP